MEDAQGNCRNLDVYELEYACVLYQAIGFIKNDLDKLEQEKDFGEMYSKLNKELKEFKTELHYLEIDFIDIEKAHKEKIDKMWGELFEN